MKDNLSILLYVSIFLILFEIILIYNNIDILIFSIAIFGQILLLISIYLKHNFLCEISHKLFQLTIFLIILFSNNKYSLSLLLLILLLTAYFRNKQGICPFRELDKSKPGNTNKMNLIILGLSIITLTKLIFIS